MKNKFKSKKGTTIVELIVTFALFSMFLASAAAIVTPCTNVFLRMKYLSYAQNVSDILMEKVCGELADATDLVLVDTSGTSISFDDSHGSPIYVDLEDEYLRMHYREIRVIEGKNVTEEILWEAVDWKYDVNAYHGFKIDTLNFVKVGGGNTVEIKMKIRNERLGTEYETSRTIECYSLRATDNIKIGQVLKSDEEYYADRYKD